MREDGERCGRMVRGAGGWSEVLEESWRYVWGDHARFRSMAKSAGFCELLTDGEGSTFVLEGRRSYKRVPQCVWDGAGLM